MHMPIDWPSAMTDLYDQRIDAMKARETVDEFWRLNVWQWRQAAQNERNATRLAAYKRKRAEHE